MGSTSGDRSPRRYCRTEHDQFRSTIATERGDAALAVSAPSFAGQGKRLAFVRPTVNQDDSERRRHDRIMTVETARRLSGTATKNRTHAPPKYWTLRDAANQGSQSADSSRQMSAMNSAIST